MHGEQKPQRERAGVAHDDPRRVVVVAQERERRAAGHRRERGRDQAPERRGKERERERRDRDDPTRERVHPVDQVHEVRERDDPEDRDDAPVRAEVDRAEERQRQPVERHVVADHRDQRDREDADELRGRVDPADVVVKAEQGDETCPDQDPDVRGVQVQEDDGRDQDCDHDRDAAEARQRPLVDARPVAVAGVVDRADKRRKADRKRGQGEDDRGRRQEPPANLPRAHERLEGLEERHLPKYRKRVPRPSGGWCRRAILLAFARS